MARSSDTRPLRPAVGRALVSLNQTKNEVDGKKSPASTGNCAVRTDGLHELKHTLHVSEAGGRGRAARGRTGGRVHCGGWWWRLAPRTPSFLGLR